LVLIRCREFKKIERNKNMARSESNQSRKEKKKPKNPNSKSSLKKSGANKNK
jgi:hypothetical protein